MSTRPGRDRSVSRLNLLLTPLALGVTLATGAIAASPAVAAGNLLQNPSLEAASNNGVPTCWKLAGYGSNSYTWTRTTDAHSGSYAENLKLASIKTGDRKLLSAQDSGTCAPAAVPGDQYTVGVWYKSPAGSSATPRFFAYYRASGSWVYWAGSATFGSSSAWTYVTWTTPAVPSGATNLAVGLGLDKVGSVTMDDFSLTIAGTTPAPPPAPSPGGGSTRFSQQPSGGGAILTGYPHADATCASGVRPVAENRPDNTIANNTVPPNNGATVPWGTGDDAFTLWPTERAHVTGQYKGTTDEILQWSACKWGLDENLARADAVKETHWHQSAVGDVCGPVGEASYGILQLKNQNCSGVTVDGGYPYTQQDTALAADYWGAHIRACIDGAFKGWLYDGTTVSQDIAAHESYSDPVPLTGDHGQDYVAWGCIGQWYSGGWWDAGATSYISDVQNYYVQKPWLQSGF